MLAAAVVCVLGLAGWASPAAAATLTIQPIVVCDDAGAVCAGDVFTTATKAVTTAVLTQLSGITAVNYLPTNQFKSSAFLDLTCGGLTNQCQSALDLFNGAGHGQNANASVYNVWSVRNLDNNASWGRAAVPGNGAVVDEEIVQGLQYDVIAHELAHAFGYDHVPTSTPNYADQLMAPTGRNIALTPAEVNGSGGTKDHITGNSPAVKVDITGATTFENDSFFDISFNQAQNGIFLKSMTVNLVPAAAFFDIAPWPVQGPNCFVFPGCLGFPFTVSTQAGDLVGITAADITGITFDGSSLLTVNFADGAFTAGDKFSFGIDIDTFAAPDAVGATPTQLLGSLFNFNYSSGFGSSVQMAFRGTQDDGTPIIFADTADLNAFDPTAPAPVAFQLEEPNLRMPLPGTLMLLVTGAAALAAARRRQRRARIK